MKKLWIFSAVLGLFTVTSCISSFGGDPYSTSSTVPNNPPTCNAGTNQSVASGVTVYLTGTMSDPDGQDLNYMWLTGFDNPAFVVISNSYGTVPSGSTVNASFTAPTTTGDYSITLQVTDGRDTVTNRIHILVNNEAPVCDAGTNRTVIHRRTITLEGTASDPDGNTLTYSWSQSTNNPYPLTLTNTDTLTPSFQAPSYIGDFEFTLITSDGALSATDSVVISVTNNPPNLIGGTQLASATYIDQCIPLAVNATDPDGDELYFYWYLSYYPSEYTNRAEVFGITVSNVSTSNATFVSTCNIPDGAYVMRCYISDGMYSTNFRTTNWIAHYFGSAQSDDSAGSRAGSSVAISGDGAYFAYGSPYNDSDGSDCGSAYFLEADWYLGDTIYSSHGVQSFFDAGSLGGSSLALSFDGSYLGTGAPWAENLNGTFGVAYCDTTSFTPILNNYTAFTNTVKGRLGQSISVNSNADIIVVGEYISNRVQIFSRSGTTLTHVTNLTASDAIDNEYFGYSVDISSDGSTIVVGAYATDGVTNILTFIGAAYVFTESGGVWSEAQKLTSTSPSSSESFGYSVAVDHDGSTVIIGAKGAVANYTGNCGAAYIFSGTPGSYSLSQKVDNPSFGADYFGTGVDISGDGERVIIGSPYGQGTYADNGCAYVYQKNGSTWETFARLYTYNGASGDEFGTAVALSYDGTKAVVGAPGYYSDKGVTFYYRLSQ